jgi:hypothetical protein
LIEVDSEQALKLAGEINRYARMNSALLIEKLLLAEQRKDAIVPDVGMNVEPARSIEPEALEMLGSNIIARQG